MEYKSYKVKKEILKLLIKKTFTCIVKHFHFTNSKPDPLCGKAAFTLAETLIVISVLGIIATIVIPPVFKKYLEAQDRVKIKKSMTVYDFIMQNMVIENDIHSESELRLWADTEEKNQCANTSAYFKIANGNGCLFKTVDGIYWYINDIMNPIVSVKSFNNSEDAIRRAKLKNDKTTFYLYTLYDNITSSFRTDDLMYTKNNADSETAENLQNLFDWLANKNDNTSTENIADDDNDNQNNDGSAEPQIPSYFCNSSGCCANHIGGYCSEVTLPTVNAFDPKGRQTNAG